MSTNSSPQKGSSLDESQRVEPSCLGNNDDGPTYFCREDYICSEKYVHPDVYPDDYEDVSDEEARDYLGRNVSASHEDSSRQPKLVRQYNLSSKPMYIEKHEKYVYNGETEPNHVPYEWIALLCDNGTLRWRKKKHELVRK